MADSPGRSRARPFAESIAKGVQLAILTDAFERLSSAERAGLPYEDAAPDVAAALRAGWHGPRLTATTRNAAGQAAALGRAEALNVDGRPFWYFSALIDDRTSEVCEACDGVLLPASHPWWATHTPSLHLLCRSAVVAVTAAQARAMGGPTLPPPKVDVEEGFGTLADLCSWEPLPGAYPVELHEPFWPGPTGMSDRPATRFDLGPYDVHVPSAASPSRPTRARTMATLPTKKRNALPASAFALPATRQYPINDAAHTRNAAARLEQNKANLTPAQYAKAKAAIRAAEKRFGINQEAEAADKPGLSSVRRRGLHMRIGLAGGHSFEVLHASDAAGTLVHGEGCELTSLLADTASTPVWIQLTKLGAWRGHPAGPFEITRETDAEIVRNFKTTQNQHIPVDFEHASEADGASGSIPVDGAPAQGWITDLDDRGAQGLWGLVKWGELARSYILEGKYRYFSPAIRFGSKDRVTGRPIGARMTSGAIVNIPFLDGLQPLAAADRGGAQTMLNRPMLSHDFMARMRAALKCDDTATLDRMSGKCADLRDLCMTADGAMLSQGVDLKPYLSDLGALMNMPAHSEVGEILDAVEAMIAAAMEQHEALYHADEGADDDGPTTTSSTDSAEGAQTTMSDTDKALAVQLGEEKQKTATISAERDRLNTERAELSLRLKDAEAERDALKASEAKALADKTAALAEVAKRDETALQERVTLAFDTYKDAKKLTADDREDMVLSLKASPERFERRYPRIAPNQRHLLADLTGARTVDTTTSTATGEPDGKPMTTEQMNLLADKYAREGMTRERAIGRAYKEAQATHARRAS